MEETTTPADYQSVNDRMMSTSDPDAAIVRKGGESARLRTACYPSVFMATQSGAVRTHAPYHHVAGRVTGRP